MKHLLFLSVLFLSACSSIATSSNEPENTWKATKNTECADFDKVKVFQTLDNFALANVCDKDYPDLCMSMVVRIDKDFDMELWDDKYITPPEGKCFVYNGTYEYETKAESHKTVPVIDFGYKYTPASEKEATERVFEVFNDMSKSCAYHFDNVKDKSLRTEGKKFCDCIDKAVETSLTDVASNQTVATADSAEALFKEKFMKEVNNCSKKYPKAAKS